MKKYRTLLFIAGLVALLLTQYKIVMPFIYKIAASDLFLVDSKDQASQLPISTPLSGIAFMQCNNYIKTTLGPDVAITFPEDFNSANAKIVTKGAYSILSAMKNVEE